MLFESKSKIKENFYLGVYWSSKARLAILLDNSSGLSMFMWCPELEIISEEKSSLLFLINL